MQSKPLETLPLQCESLRFFNACIHYPLFESWSSRSSPGPAHFGPGAVAFSSQARPVFEILAHLICFGPGLDDRAQIGLP